jgi:hypothetical protein
MTQSSAMMSTSFSGARSRKASLNYSITVLVSVMVGSSLLVGLVVVQLDGPSPPNSSVVTAFTLSSSTVT